jgi:hypothetical protein
MKAASGRRHVDGCGWLQRSSKRWSVGEVYWKPQRSGQQPNNQPNDPSQPSPPWVTRSPREVGEGGGAGGGGQPPPLHPASRTFASSATRRRLDSIDNTTAASLASGRRPRGVSGMAIGAPSAPCTSAHTTLGRKCSLAEPDRRFPPSHCDNDAEEQPVQDAGGPAAPSTGTEVGTGLGVGWGWMGEEGQGRGTAEWGVSHMGQRAA